MERTLDLAEGNDAVNRQNLTGVVVHQLEAHVLAALTYGTYEHLAIHGHAATATALVVDKCAQSVFLRILQTLDLSNHGHVVCKGVHVIAENIVGCVLRNKALHSRCGIRGSRNQSSGELHGDSFCRVTVIHEAFTFIQFEVGVTSPTVVSCAIDDKACLRDDAVAIGWVVVCSEDFGDATQLKAELIRIVHPVIALYDGLVVSLRGQRSHYSISVPINRSGLVSLDLIHSEVSREVGEGTYVTIGRVVPKQFFL